MGFFDCIPIRPAHDDVGMKTLLHQIDAFIVVAMSMRNDDVFHRRRIEPELR
jgi:hypothetical protein